MPVSQSALPRHLRPRREKVFGDGRPRPLDRNAKVAHHAPRPRPHAPHGEGQGLRHRSRPRPLPS